MGKILVFLEEDGRIHFTEKGSDSAKIYERGKTYAHLGETDLSFIVDRPATLKRKSLTQKFKAFFGEAQGL